MKDAHGSAVSDLYYFSYLPAAIFVVDIALRFFRRRAQMPNPAPEAPRPLQIWLQDLLLVPPLFVLALTVGFDRGNLETLFIPTISLAIGFTAALDICSAYNVRGALSRGFIFAAVMGLCIVVVWLAATLWYFERLFRARKIQPRLPDAASLRIAAAAALISAISFAVPMGQGKILYGARPMQFNSFGSIDGELYGFGAYVVSIQSYFQIVRVALGGIPLGLFDYGISFGDGRLPWLANPIFWVATCFLLEGRAGMAAFIAAGACGLAAGAHGPTPFTLLNSPGYVVWFSSMALLAICALVKALRRGKTPETRLTN